LNPALLISVKHTVTVASPSLSEFFEKLATFSLVSALVNTADF